MESCKIIIPAVCITEKGECIINRTEIKGNKINETMGILCKYGDIVVKDSKIHSHLAGGIHILSNKNNTVKIANSRIINNKHVGM